MLFGKSDKFIKLDQVRIPIILQAFLVINVIVFISLILFVILRWSYRKIKATKNTSLVSSIRSFLPSIILIFIFPILCLIVLFFITSIFDVAILSFKGTNNFGEALFISLKPDFIDQDIWANLADNSKFSPVEQGTYSTMPVSAAELIFFPSVIGFSLLVVMSKTLVKLANYTFQYVLLFSVSPFVFSSLIVDQGQRFRKWGRYFATRLLGIFILLFNLYFFTFFAKVINQWVFSLVDLSYFTRMTLMAILIIGGAKSLEKATKIILRIIGIETKTKEMMVENKNLMKEYFSFMTKNKQYKIETKTSEKDLVFKTSIEKELENSDTRFRIQI
ncbi:hypothetical protein JV122_02260 [Mycoplasma procyoni]|nr:hypothetical protein [Mycoplasma procyoni]MBN3534786.1 hypothetical protein [Mycoplasma procyoni]